MAGRIYDRMKEGEKKEIAMEIEKEQVDNTGGLNGRKRTGKRLSWIWSRFFLYQEIVQRRCRHRRNCRHYY